MWRVKWWRVGVALLICFAAFWLAGFIWQEWANWQLAQQFLRENPNLAVVPVPLPDKSVAKLAGTRVAVAGLSFQVPWGEIFRQRGFETRSVVNFTDGEVLMLSDPSHASDTEKALWAFAKTPQQADAFKHAFGPELLNCCYAIMASELAATPSQMTWWNTRTGSAKSFRLLLRKSTQVIDSKAIYELNAGEMRGFQMGDPTAAPYEVTLQLFDRNDRRHEISISQYGAKKPFLAQSEINAIVASIQLIPQK
jgi:hypothetical protein